MLVPPRQPEQRYLVQQWTYVWFKFTVVPPFILAATIILQPAKLSTGAGVTVTYIQSRIFHCVPLKKVDSFETGYDPVILSMTDLDM